MTTAPPRSRPTSGPAGPPDGGAGFRTYFGLTFATFVLATALRQLLDHNEADVLVGALHARDPSFVPGDWYLGLEIPYRDVFNFLGGSLAHALGLLPSAVVGRLLGIACIAAALAPLFARLRVPPALVVPLLVVYQRYRSVVAEEWIVGSFETKTFAYAAALGALGFVLRRRFVLAAVLSGLAVSCHVLVGTYAAGTLVATALWSRRRDAVVADAVAPGAARSPARWLVPLAAGLLAALPGLVAIARMFAAGVGVDRTAAGEIYVLLRVPHHTYPPHWHTPGSLLRGGLALALLVVGLRAGRSATTRFVARYALVTSVFAIVGLLVLASGRVDLLKVYWFRFPDGIWPLAATLVAGALVAERVPGARRPRRLVAVALACAGWATLAPAFARDAAGLASTTRADPVYLRTMPAGPRAALLWARDHTPPDATILVDPFVSRAYLASERAQAVSFKCVPQTDREILLWAARLAVLAGVTDLREGGVAALARLATQADRLPAETVARAQRELGAGWYVAAADHALPWPVAAEGPGYRVFRLDGGPTATGR